MSTRAITRRDFLLKTSAAAALATTAYLPAFGHQESDKRTRVILVRDRDVMTGEGQIDRAVLDKMMDRALMKIFDAGTPSAAWSKIFNSSDIVGIKSNAWRYLPTPPEVEETLKSRLISIGIPEKNISVDDRGVLRNPVFGKATALINARPLRAHHWSGVGGCLKNYIMFTPQPSDLHRDSCVDLGALWKLPVVKGKTKLNVLVMLTPQFHCLGPHHFDKEYIWNYNGLLIGTDPVALDAVGLKILEAKRSLFFNEYSPMRPSAKHIRAAEVKHGIGIADLEKIDLTKLGWQEGILI